MPKFDFALATNIVVACSLFHPSDLFALGSVSQHRLNTNSFRIINEASVATTITSDAETYSNDSYTISNNPWGKGSLVNGIDYSISATFDPTVIPNDVEFSWVWHQSGSGVLAYPCVSFDPRSSYGVNALQASNIANLVANYSVNVTGNTRKFTVAFDVWFKKEPNGQFETFTHELLIEVHAIERGKSNQSYTFKDPALTNATVYVEYNWGNYPVGHTWTFIDVKSSADVLYGTLSISDIIKTLIWNGVMTGQEYVDSIQLGSEVHGGNGNLKIHNLSYDWHAKPSLLGTAGNDTFVINDMGGNTVIGGGGTDTVIYNGLYSDYQIKQSGSIILITEGSKISTLDKLQDVKFLQFSDGAYDAGNAIFTYK